MQIKFVVASHCRDCRMAGSGKKENRVIAESSVWYLAADCGSMCCVCMGRECPSVSSHPHILPSCIKALDRPAPSDHPADAIDPSIPYLPCPQGEFMLDHADGLAFSRPRSVVRRLFADGRLRDQLIETGDPSANDADTEHASFDVDDRADSVKPCFPAEEDLIAESFELNEGGIV